MTWVILIIIGMKREKVPPCLISVLLNHTCWSVFGGRQGYAPIRH